MKQNAVLTIASLLTILLMTLHMTDDIVRGMEPGTLLNLIVVPIIGLRLGRSWREAVAAHDLRHLCSVRRTAGVALITSAASRKNCGPIAAGVITHSAFASWLPLLSNR